MRTVFVIAFVAIHFLATAQSNSFPFGQVTYRDMDMKTYVKDTAAIAVVLREEGDTYIEDAEPNYLVHHYHVRIKILKKAGQALADFVIPLRKGDGINKESMRSVTASSFNIENGSMKETKLNAKDQFTENTSKYYDQRKFAVPNVRVGSVIEVEYTLESPFKFNFRSWEFQSDIPKISSLYTAKIPANYRYNISLRGYLKLAKNENRIERDCYRPRGYSAECTVMEFMMKDVPAFEEEEYMTARSNFLSAVYFELSEYLYFDGHKDKITKEWKDVEDEMKKQTDFGVQLRRGEDIVDREVKQVIAGETDELAKARKIYDFIKGWYRWNNVRGIFSDLGIKKAYDSKTGSVGDINLSLVAALKYAELNADPIILSTRANGLVNELFPVISEFDYVAAYLTIKDKVYLLDATDPFLAFGMLPERCLNGKGRVLGEKQSFWYDLKPSEKDRKVSIFNLKLSKEGVLTGTAQITHFGYGAVDERKRLISEGDEKAYLHSEYPNVTLAQQRIENLEDLKKPLTIKFETETELFDEATAGDFLFNPFFMDQWDKNPFKSLERSYPVDFGAPPEETMVVILEYPEEYEIAEIPAKVGLVLPDAGGRFMYTVQNVGHTLTMNSTFSINKTVFTSLEYHYLRELYDRVLAVQKADLVFKKKT
jgi:hypothetical protein